MSAELDPALAAARKMYFEECAELLSDAAERLTHLGDTLEKTDPEEVNAIFRAVHSAKGGGGAWGLTDLASFAHTFEALLGAVRDGSVGISGEIADMLIEANDVLTTLLQNAEQGVQADPSEWSGLADNLKAATAGASAAPASNNTAPELAAGPRTCVFKLEPILDNSTAADVRTAILESMADVDKIEIDGQMVERVTTLGVQVLLSAAKEMANRGGSFTLTKSSPLLDESLGALGMSELADS